MTEQQVSKERFESRTPYDRGYEAGKNHESIHLNPYTDPADSWKWQEGWVAGTRDWDDSPEWTI